MPALRAALAWLRSSPRLRAGCAGLLLTAAGRLSGQAAAALPALAAPPPSDEAALAPADALALARAAWSDQLWEDGCLLPGGTAEIQRLSALLPLSPATTLLLVGRDAGGAAATIVTRRGAWVAAHQHDPLLAERMAARLRPLGRRATVLSWQPEAPAFRPRFHHHALALEPLAGGGRLDSLLAAIAAALKPDAQLVLLELVLGDAAAAQRPVLERWLALEGRPAPPPARQAAEAAFQAAGFQLHVTEDAGPRHCIAVTEGWARLIGGLRGTGQQTARSGAAALIAEAELWLLRHRLLTTGAIGLLRWHATLRR